MSAPTLDSFFAGGGGKSFSWKDMPDGTTVAGTITSVGAPQQQTDPVDQKPVFKKDGVTPKMTVPIELQTNLRDPSDPEDDGARTVWVQGWMTGAIGDAIRKATGKPGAPQVGGFLQVTLTHREPNRDNPRLNPTNKFAAVYQPPQQQATQQFFDQGQQQVVHQPPPQQQQMAPPAPVQQYQQPPVQQAPPQQQQAPTPVKPPQMSDEAWNALPPASQIAVAQAMNPDSIPY